MSKTIQEQLKENEMFQLIKYEPLINFTADMCDLLAHDNKTKTTNNIKSATISCKMALKLFEGKGQYHEGDRANWLYIVVASCFIYYFTYDSQSPVTCVFKPHELTVNKLIDPADYKIDPAVLVALFEMIEASNGPTNKIRKCDPIPNSPQQVLGEVIFLQKNFTISPKNE